MTEERGNKKPMARKHRVTQLDERLKASLASQIKDLRGEMSQAEFGRLIGKPQNVVSRLEDPDYGRVTLQTLLDIASKLDIALIVRFTSHANYLKIGKTLSLKAFPATKATSRKVGRAPSPKAEQ